MQPTAPKPIFKPLSTGKNGTGLQRGRLKRDIDAMTMAEDCPADPGAAARGRMAGGDPAGAATRPWLVMAGLVVPINIMMALDKNSFALAAPMIGNALKLDYVQVSTVIAALTWSYAIMQLPSGWLVSHLGPHRTLGWACMAWSAVTIGMPWASGFVSFLVFRIAMGTFQAADWSASVTAVHDWFAPAKRSRGNAVLLGCLYFGSTLSGPLTTQAVTLIGWRHCLHMFGVVGLVLSTLWLLVYRDGPYRGPRDDPPRLSRRAFATLLCSPRLWAIGAFYFCALSMQSFYHVNLPHYLMSARHLSYNAMGWVFALPWLCLYLSVVASGFASDAILRRSGSPFKARAVFGAAGAALSALSLEAAAYCDSNLAAITLLCVALAALGMCQVAIWSLAQGLTRRFSGVVVGWTGFWGNVAAGSMPILISRMLGHGASWGAALAVPCALGLLGAGFCLIAGREGQKPLLDDL
ncbi:D-galactonate transporter [Gluconacetobacter sacchari DSM 12717]|uniref:MFS transporter n=2 Tax=Gluconacetobacter sacchari TaxID=92759 RepID=A0A7W4IGQ2_9PROT|nr:MFS transporter [Gluconacetobacter sacchari]MBB2162392.1 MFS transporter [Gluconacetobacter sacchari]GBQ22977.1 D-galactonate transporter [Gluconacetobacter sacchari DSM 12717]